MPESTTPSVRNAAPGFHIDTDGASKLKQEIVPQAERWTALLRGTYAPEEWPQVTIRGLGPETVTFCRTMAGVQEGHGVSLGRPTTTAEGIRTRLAVAEQLEPAIQALGELLGTLKTVWAINLGAASRGAQEIYRRAVVVAENNSAVEMAIEPIRTARTRVAKKAAFTRKRRAEEKAKRGPTEG